MGRLGDYELGLIRSANQAIALAELNENAAAANLAGTEVTLFRIYGYLPADDKAFCNPLLEVCRALELLVIEDSEAAQYTNQYLKDRAGRAYARFVSDTDKGAPQNGKQQKTANE
jgi:hypothetical protein